MNTFIYLESSHEDNWNAVGFYFYASWNYRR